MYKVIGTFNNWKNLRIVTPPTWDEMCNYSFSDAQNKTKQNAGLMQWKIFETSTNINWSNLSDGNLEQLQIQCSWGAHREGNGLIHLPRY